MDGYKVGSARIYQLFSNASGGSSNNNDSSSKSTEVQKTPPQNVVTQNTDAVRVSPAVLQEQAARATKVQELKQQVQSGEYQKQLKNPTTLQQVAKSVVEFYSA
jgi:anti-sigma28 factor (negative regulator of flagellin synthesis)